MSLDALRKNLPSIDSIKQTIDMAPTLPKTYKVAVFKEANAPLTLEDVELKQPIEGEILIKVLATGVCRSDQGVQGGHFGNSL